jgi:hypothetical protein
VTPAATDRQPCAPARRLRKAAAARHTRPVDDDTAATTVTARQRIGAAGRALLGAVSLVGGLTWILLNLDRPEPGTDLIVGAVLAVGGLVLLMPHRVPLAGRATAAAAGGAAIVGTLGGLLVAGEQIAGSYAYVATRGWPFNWLARGAAADDPQTARQLADQASWQLDAVNLVAVAYFWALAGLLLVALTGRFRQTAAGTPAREDGRPRP